MDLVINNRVIDTPIPTILNTIREELGVNLFSSIKEILLYFIAFSK